MIITGCLRLAQASAPAANPLEDDITGELTGRQFLFSVIILGISVSLIKGQNYPSAVPSQTSYAAFCGGWGIIIALIGIAALFVEALQGIIVAGLDGLTALLTLAGGIVSLHELQLKPVRYVNIKNYPYRKRNILTSFYYRPFGQH